MPRSVCAGVSGRATRSTCSGASPQAKAPVSRAPRQAAKKGAATPMAEGNDRLVPVYCGTGDRKLLGHFDVDTELVTPKVSCCKEILL